MTKSDSQTATLEELCTGAGFSRIVYVDDYFGPSPERIGELIRDRTESELRSISALQLDGVEDEYLYEAANAAALRITSAAARQKLFAELAAKVEGTDAVDADVIAIQAFRGKLGTMKPGAVLELSMAQWEAQRDELVRQAAANVVTLFVFDDDFRLEGRDAMEGRRQLRWVRAKLKGRRHATVLLTHGAQTEQDEPEIEAEIQQADIEEGLRTVVISKEPLHRGTDGLVRRVKYALLQDHFLELRGTVKAAVDAAGKVALEVLSSMGVSQFERIIVHSSLSEGAWCPETMTRVVWVNQEKAVRRALRMNRRVHEMVKAIEPLARVMTGPPSTADIERASSLQHSEVVDSSSDIAGTFVPLELGDIFEWRGKRYVLIAQSCDLAVRADGSRNRDEDRLVALVELRQDKHEEGPRPETASSRDNSEEARSSPSDSAGRSGQLASGALPEPRAEKGCGAGCPLPTGSMSDERVFTIANGSPDGTPLTVLFDLTIYVPTWILDLAVISPVGECELVADTVPSELLQSSWQSRLRMLKKQIQKEVVALYRAITEPPKRPNVKDDSLARSPNGTGSTPTSSLDKHQKIRLARSLLRLPLGCKFEPQIELLPADKWKIRIDGLKRVQRVRERHAMPLLAAFMQYAARPAYPHEYTRMSGLSSAH